MLHGLKGNNIVESIGVLLSLCLHARTELDDALGLIGQRWRADLSASLLLTRLLGRVLRGGPAGVCQPDHPRKQQRRRPRLTVHARTFAPSSRPAAFHLSLCPPSPLALLMIMTLPTDNIGEHIGESLTDAPDLCVHAPAASSTQSSGNSRMRSGEPALSPFRLFEVTLSIWPLLPRPTSASYLQTKIRGVARWS